MAEPKLCEDCRKFMLELLDARIRRILEVGREELTEDDAENEHERDIGQSHCFHLMEIQRILEGKKTCGIYDDYGDPPTISGPLFKAASGEPGASHE